MLARIIANTTDSIEYDPSAVAGGFFCFAPDVSLAGFINDRICEELDPIDSGTNGVTDLCENDDNDNGIPDDIDIVNDPTLDCDNDGVLDSAQRYGFRQFLQQPTSIPIEELGDRFGEALATDGISLAVGAQNERTLEGSPGFFFETGAVYVYEQIGVDSDWTQRGSRVDPSVLTGSASINSLFGFSVDIEGDTLVIGAPNHDAPGDTNTGAVFVFEYDSLLGEWLHAQTIYPDLSYLNRDGFGWSVALDGDHLLIGHPDARLQGSAAGAGSAEYFTRDPGTGIWSLQRIYTVADAFEIPNGDDRFGRQVAFVGNTAIVSAPRRDLPGDTNPGVIYSFDRSTNLPGIPLLASDAAGIATTQVQEFGTQISGHGSILAVGVDEVLGGSIPTGGRVFLYQLDPPNGISPSWSVIPSIVPSDLEIGDQFGFSVSVYDDHSAGSWVSVGAPSDSNPTGEDEGSAYLFKRSSTGNWDRMNKFFLQQDSPGRTRFGTSVAHFAGDTFISTVDDQATSSPTDGDLQRVDYFGPVPSCVVNGCNQADLSTPFGVLNFFDVAEYINRYNKCDSSADLASPFGVCNFFDVAAFISIYNQGCP